MNAVYDSTIDPVDALEALAADGADVWESAISAGIEAGASIDSGKWVIGDIACLVEKQYGEDRIGDFAKSINVERDRVVEWRGVCRFFDRPTRTALRASRPNLSYTHFREAKRLKDKAKAIAFLEEAADNDWNVERARIELRAQTGKPLPPLKLVDTKATVRRIEGLKVTFDLNPGATGKLLDAWYEKRPVRLVVYEVEEARRE